MSVETETAPYPVTPRNRVKRMHERASYDREAVHAVLDAAMPRAAHDDRLCERAEREGNVDTAHTGGS